MWRLASGDRDWAQEMLFRARPVAGSLRRTRSIRRWAAAYGDGRRRVGIGVGVGKGDERTPVTCTCV